jgi:hypothetical protein
MFYVGIDIAKHNHEASIIDADGKLLCESISFTNIQKGCKKLVALLGGLIWLIYYQEKNCHWLLSLRLLCAYAVSYLVMQHQSKVAPLRLSLLYICQAFQHLQVLLLNIQ